MFSVYDVILIVVILVLEVKLFASLDLDDGLSNKKRIKGKNYLHYFEKYSKTTTKYDLKVKIHYVDFYAYSI